MRSLWIIAALSLVGCRGPARHARPAARTEADPPRPSSVMGVLELPDPVGFARELGAAMGADLPTLALLGGSFGIEPSRLAAADLARPAHVALTPDGLVVALSCGGARAAEQALAGRWRLDEEPSLGAWIVRDADASTARPCALLEPVAGDARIVCGPSRASVRAVAPWLARRRAEATGPVLRATLRDEALARTAFPALAMAVRAGADWLDERASEARGARGAPTYGDPEPIVRAIRSGANDLESLGEALRDLRLDASFEAGALRVTLRATLRDGARGSLATLARWGASSPGALELTAPATGFGAALRAPDALSAGWWREGTALALDVLGPRVADRSGVERSLSMLGEKLGGAWSLAGSYGSERSGATVRVAASGEGLHGALARVATAPWWSGIRADGPLRARWDGAVMALATARGPLATVAVDDGALTLRAGAAVDGAQVRERGAFAGVVARLGAEPEGALRVWARATQEPTGVGCALEASVGRRWLRAGMALSGSGSQDR